MTSRTASRLSILYDVHVLAGLSHTLVEESLADVELTGSEFAFYSLLIAEGPLTVTEAADWSAMPLATASKLIARLVQRGHVIRVENPTDGRSTLIELNAAGRRAHEEAKVGFGRMLRGLLAELGSAGDEVRWALARLETAMRTRLEEPPEASPVPKPAEHHVGYAGPPLDPDEEKAVRDYVAWLVWRRGR